MKILGKVDWRENRQTLKSNVAKEKDFFEGIAKNKRFEAFGKGELSFDDVLSDYAKEYAELVNN